MGDGFSDFSAALSCAPEAELDGPEAACSLDWRRTMRIPAQSRATIPTPIRHISNCWISTEPNRHPPCDSANPGVPVSGIALPPSVDVLPQECAVSVRLKVPYYRPDSTECYRSQSRNSSCTPLPPPRQRQRRASRVRAGRARDGAPRRLIVAEIQFAFGEGDRPVEHHLQRTSPRQYRVRTARSQHADHARGGTRRGADSRAHPIVPRGATGDGSDGGARRPRLAHGARIAALVAFAAHFAFRPVQLTGGIAVHGADASVEIARHAVGQGQRIEAHVEFAAALDAARLL